MLRDNKRDAISVRYYRPSRHASKRGRVLQSRQKPSNFDSIMSKVDIYVSTTKLGRFVKETKGCFMIQRFSPYAKVCTLFGCFFIRNLDGSSLYKATATWRSPYTLYALAWFVLVLTTEAFIIFNKITYTNIKIFFTDVLITTIHMCSFFMSIINILCMTLGSKKLLELFRKAALFERSSGIGCLLRQRWTTGRWPRALRKVGVAASGAILTGLCVAIIIANHFKVGERALNLTLPSLLIRLVSQLMFVFWECLMYIVVSSVSEVLVDYLRSQKQRLRECQRCVEEQRLDSEMAASAVETIRKNVSTIRTLKTHLNAIWDPAMVAFLVCSLWVHCTSWYCLFTNEAYHVRIWLGMSYSCYSAFRLLDLAVISHDLRSEARHIQGVTRNATLAHARDTYKRQIRFLHDSVDPKGMRLKGGHFFYIDMTLLVSMAGSVITYTVILVQTNHGFSYQAGVCLANTTT
ncbi:hypothetical protein MTO96_014758 [Rhipicephalus appendiculatus]